MQPFKIKNNIPVENIGQTHPFHAEGDGKSSSQEAAETPKCEESYEQTDNSSIARAIDGEKVPAEWQKEDFLEDLATYRRAAAKAGKWSVVVRMMELEIKLWLNNRVPQNPIGSLGM